MYSTINSIAIMKFQAAVAEKNSSRLSKILSDNCVMLVLSKNKMYVGKESVIKNYQEQLFDIDSRIKEFIVTISNTHDFQKYKITGKCVVDGFYDLIEVKISFVVENGLIKGIVRDYEN